MCAYVLHILHSGCILESRDKPTSHCLISTLMVTIILIPISVLKILVHIVHFCVARTVKLRFFFTVVSDCELVGDEWGRI